MSKMKYDPHSETFVAAEGWRSWGCVIALVHYWVTLMVIVWMSVLWTILAIPYILVCIAIGFAIALVLGYI